MMNFSVSLIAATMALCARSTQLATALDIERLENPEYGTVNIGHSYVHGSYKVDADDYFNSPYFSMEEAISHYNPHVPHLQDQESDGIVDVGSSTETHVVYRQSADDSRKRDYGFTPANSKSYFTPFDDSHYGSSVIDFDSYGSSAIDFDSYDRDVKYYPNSQIENDYGKSINDRIYEPRRQEQGYRSVRSKKNRGVNRRDRSYRGSRGYGKSYGAYSSGYGHRNDDKKSYEFGFGHRDDDYDDYSSGYGHRDDDYDGYGNSFDTGYDKPYSRRSYNSKSYSRPSVDYDVYGPKASLGVYRPKASLGVYRPDFDFKSKRGNLGVYGPKLGNTFERPSIEQDRPKFTFNRPQVSFSAGRAKTSAPRASYYAPETRQVYKRPDIAFRAPRSKARAYGPRPSFDVYGPKASLDVYGPSTSYRRSSPKAYLNPRQSYGYSSKNW